MPSELRLRLTGGVHNTDPEKATGGATSAWPVDLVNLFPDVPLADTVKGQTLYRAVDLLNVGTQGARHIQAWTAPSDNLELAVTECDDVGLVLPGFPPWDHGHYVETFAKYSKASPLPIPDILCGGKRRLWLKRTIPARSTTGADSETLRLSYL